MCKWTLWCIDLVSKDQKMWSLKGLVKEFGYGGGGERKKKMKKNVERSERMRDLERE